MAEWEAEKHEKREYLKDYKEGIPLRVQDSNVGHENKTQGLEGIQGH